MNVWKPIAAALVIFAAGVVTGGLTVKLRSPAGQPRAALADRTRSPGLQRAESQLRDLSRRMSDRLELSPVQRERIETIVRESQKRMRTLWEETAPKTREEFRRMRERIRAELTPDQRGKFEELFKQRKRAESSSPAPGED